MIDYFAGAQAVPESEWPEYKKVSGIYAIRHIASSKFYVGSSVDICTRWRRHREELNAKRHKNSHLQNAWNKYGKGAFEFLLVEQTSREHAVPVEQVWMDWTQAAARGYNISPTAGSTLGVPVSPQAREKLAAANRGKKYSQETRDKVAAAGRGRKHSEESRGKIGSAHRGMKRPPEMAGKLRAANLGKKASPETKAKMSAVRKGRKHSPEHTARKAAANTGKRRSEEARKANAYSKRALSPLTESIVKQMRSRYVSGDKVNGCSALAREFGVSPSAVSNIINGKTWA